ncbi:MAG: TRAP transporter small permease subunit [Pseudomonadota bacterium]
MTDWIEGLNRRIGQLVAWLTLAMVLNTLAVLIGRDVFGFGRIWLQELTTWMHATVFLVAAAYTLQADQHVRVDVFYRGFSKHRKALVDLIGNLLLLTPFCVILVIHSWGYVTGSWAALEASRQAGGLPYPATPLLKTFMLVMPTLLLLQALAQSIKAWRTVRR